MKTGLYKTLNQQLKRRKEVADRSDTVGKSVLLDDRPTTIYQRRLQERMNAHHPSPKLFLPKRSEGSGYEKTRLRTVTLPQPMKNPTSTVTHVFQLARNVDADREKLGRVYDVITHEDVKDPNDWLMYVSFIFGMEENPNYRLMRGDSKLLNDHRFIAQEKVYGSKKYGELTAKEKKRRIKLNKKYFKNFGDYFFVSNPNHDDDRQSSERMIINVSSQQRAGQLLKWIADGWDAEVQDWRQDVLSAKFYGLKCKRKHKKQNLKYDKVVIFYNNGQGQARERIKQGVEQSIPEEERIPLLSAFYNEIGVGIGIGEETNGDNWGGSFTQRRVNYLFDWITQRQEEINQMNKETFIYKAEAVILEGMPNTTE
ncbi:MAG: hypothetical protein AAGA66_13115 [Bacteroidota bacterium]